MLLAVLIISTVVKEDMQITERATEFSASEPPVTNTTTVDPSPTPASIEPCQTCMLDKWHNVFFGTIGTEEICMDIYQDGNNLTAFYIYNKSENEYKLVGNINGFKITLKDDNQNTLTGTLTSADEPGGRLNGTLIQSNGNELSVLLDMSYACGATLDNFYEIMGSNNQEVETFLNELKKKIISEDKEAVAQLINYPINVSIDNMDTTILSSQEFINNYNKIIDKDLVDKISKAYTKFVFNNYRGVMFCNFWIQKTNDNLKIIGINN
jgi:hypothetical protein